MLFVTFQPIKNNSEFNEQEFYSCFYKDAIWCCGYENPKKIIFDCLMAHPHFPQKVIIFEASEYKKVCAPKWEAYLYHNCNKIVNKRIKNPLRSKTVELANGFDDTQTNFYEYIVDKNNINVLFEFCFSKNGNVLYNTKNVNIIYKQLKKCACLNDKFIKYIVEVFYSSVDICIYQLQANEHSKKYIEIQMLQIASMLFTIILMPFIIMSITNDNRVAYLPYIEYKYNSPMQYVYFLRHYTQKHTNLLRKYDIELEKDVRKSISLLRNVYESMFKFIKKEFKTYSKKELLNMICEYNKTKK